MGATKRFIEHLAAQECAAVEIAVHVDLLRRCANCDCVTDPGNNNYEDAYRFGNTLISKGDPLAEVFDGDRRRMTDLIKNITTNYGPKCDCQLRFEKYMAKD